jgi:hypothetical protein
MMTGELAALPDDIPTQLTSDLASERRGIRLKSTRFSLLPRNTLILGFVSVSLFFFVSPFRNSIYSMQQHGSGDDQTVYQLYSTSLKSHSLSYSIFARFLEN